MQTAFSILRPRIAYPLARARDFPLMGSCSIRATTRLPCLKKAVMVCWWMLGPSALSIRIRSS